MSIKAIFVDVNDDYKESEAGVYEVSEYVSASAGPASAGKPVVLDAGGKIGATLIDPGVINHNSLLNSHNLTTDIDHDQITNTHNLTSDINHNTILNNHNLTSDIDHGSIAGLGDDDHTQYLKADGTRAITGIQSYNNHKTFTPGSVEVPDVKYVDDSIAALGNNFEWMNSVLDKDDTPPASPTLGDRYLIIATASGAWLGHEDDVAEWNGSSWVFTTPSIGTYVSVDTDVTHLYYYGGSGWTVKEFEHNTASKGVKLDDGDIQADLLTGGGLKLDVNSLAVEPADFAGEGLKDDGSDNLAIDWSIAFNDSKAVKASDLKSVANAKGASIIGLEDSAGNTTATNVEAAIADIFSKISGGSTELLSDGGVVKGDLIYIPSGDKGKTMPINVAGIEPIGIADRTAADGVIFRAVEDDRVVKGVLTALGVSGGEKIYWSGTALTATRPAGAGKRIIITGVAKNSNDLYVNIRYVKTES